MAAEFRTRAERWDAVVGRAKEAAGSFYYGVLTTGVFCRPGCASRQPRRENVVFFDDVRSALEAGYRPCKRCRPQGADTATHDFLSRACGLLAAQEAARTRDVARALGLSNGYFQRRFKRELGVTPQAYRRRVLAERARTALPQADSVTAAVHGAGYSSSSRFYAGVARELGMSPRAAQVGAAGERIAFVVRSCSLGRVLIAWTDRGVCQVSLGESDAQLTEELRRLFPKARIEPRRGNAWTRAVVEAVDGDSQLAQEIPTDLRGTAFQERVWQVLRTIRPGETRTYAQVAAALGEPTAARAVARACASNRHAVLVPCHRVVRRDGGLGGYRWGLERKAVLLERERRSVAPADTDTANERGRP